MNGAPGNQGAVFIFCLFFMTHPLPVCARCPKALGTSCCEVKDDDHLATLTASDVHRIHDFIGKRADTFSESEWLSEKEVQEYEARRPLYQGYFRHEPRRLTLRRRDGACIFLDRQTGCRLPADVRPTACRLYPFELWAEGWSLQISRFGSVKDAQTSGEHACLAVEEADSMDAARALLGVTREDIEALGEQLRREVKDHARSPYEQVKPLRR
jgi:uncharacterized protein